MLTCSGRVSAGESSAKASTTSSTSPVGRVGVDRLGRAGHDPAGDGDDALDPHRLGGGERGGAGLEHQLGQAGMVAQVDEE